MDEFDSQLYYGIKDALRKLSKNVLEDTLEYDHMPIILIDFYRFEAPYFPCESDALEYLEEFHTDCTDGPPDGEDEDLVLLKFCTKEDKYRYPNLYDEYTFYKKIGNKEVYRNKSFVEFEPELVVNISI